MGPGVLMTLKGSFPAVAALLLSPQFMIAGGVAVGVTIVALGGYKIIKKMQVQKEVDAPLPEPQMAMPMRAATMPIEDSNNQLDELEPQELSRVELWRRGIADVEANSSGTSVDGEFITPEASRTLCAAGVLDEDDLKSRRSTRSKKHSSESKHKEHKEHKHRAPKSEVSVKTSKTSDSKRPSSKVASSKVASSKVASSKSGKESSKESSKTKKKEKEPSGLKMLFRAHTVAV